jgi:putative endonuclease
MPYMYILRCSDGSYYTGSTVDIELRLAQHQEGLGAEYTKHRRPVTIAFAQWHERVDDAFESEKRVQGWSRAKKEALMRGDDAVIQRLSRRPRSGGRPVSG